MAFLIIDESIPKTRKILKERRMKIQMGLEISEAQVEDIDKKLLTLDRYERHYKKKSEYSKIKMLKHTKPNVYVKRCKRLIKDIKGISFLEAKMLFKVQKTFNGRKVWGGEFTDLDEAIEVLEVLISQNN